MREGWGGGGRKVREKRRGVGKRKEGRGEGREKGEDGEDREGRGEEGGERGEMARQPLVADRMVDFLKRSNQLLTKIIEK